MIPVFPEPTALANAARDYVAGYKPKPRRITYTVTPADFLGWRVYTDTAHYTSKAFLLQYRAIAWARSQALAAYDEGRGVNSQVRIKGRDGRYRDEWSYGDDPTDSPG